VEEEREEQLLSCITQVSDGQQIQVLLLKILLYVSCPCYAGFSINFILEEFRRDQASSS
jgi:hypothetical protein